MIKVEKFINELDGNTLLKITSDNNKYVKEIATGALYVEAVIPVTRSEKEFIETDVEIEKDK